MEIKDFSVFCFRCKDNHIVPDLVEKEYSPRFKSFKCPENKDITLLSWIKNREVFP